MAVDDIRIALDLPDHRKTRKLIAMSGEPAFRCLVRLWCFAAKRRPDGVFRRMDTGDIEAEAGWDGGPGELVDALTESGFIKKTGRCMAIHDWEESQPWVVGSTMRSAAAKLASLTRWHESGKHKQVPNPHCPRCLETPSHDGGLQNAARTEAHANRNPPTPVPVPVPSPVQLGADAPRITRPNQTEAQQLVNRVIEVGLRGIRPAAYGNHAKKAAHLLTLESLDYWMRACDAMGSIWPYNTGAAWSIFKLEKHAPEALAEHERPQQPETISQKLWREAQEMDE